MATNSRSVQRRLAAQRDAGCYAGRYADLLVKPIMYFGTANVLACDGRCDKAFGVNGRPKVQLSDDEDDYEWLADSEVGDAPTDPGTYEGGNGKPQDYSDPKRQNKWCARECERSVMVEIGLVELTDFTKRVRNKS